MHCNNHQPDIQEYMKPIILFLPLFLVAYSLQAQNSNDATQAIHFNHFQFKAPESWKSTQAPNYFEMHPPDLAKDELLSYFIMPSVTDTGFKTVAVKTLNELAVGMSGEAFASSVFGNSPLYEEENRGRYVKGWEYSIGHGHIRVKYQTSSPGIYNYNIYTIGVFLAQIHDRMERVVYLSKDLRRGLSENSTYRKPSYERIIKDFFFTIDFDDWTDTRYASGKVTHSGISDVWGGTAYFEGGVGSVYTEGSVKGTYLIFLDNGQVYYNQEMPVNGLQGVNTYIEATTSPRWWGTYTYKDGKGTIKLNYETIPFTLENGRIMLSIYKTTLPYERFPSSDNARLNGTWCQKARLDNKAVCISFTPDGNFSDDGVIHRIEHLINDCFPGVPVSGQGTYEIKNNSILFKYNNGQIYKTAFSGLKFRPADPSPKALYLGYHDDLFQKQ